ncbi:MAG: tetratricopeptide repeat protein [Deltaproteobacteria bacterium]|nr:MAG: tetratricopeptide repeat protein [Deltaproteobacteria bacterium]
MRVELGAFELVEPLGAGGMSEVWRGVHRASGLPVAVKMLHARGSTAEEREARFTSEVRAAARLDHPGIVTVLDYGVIRPAQADASQGLTAGRPYLVMEYASGGTVLGRHHPQSWPELRAMTARVLEALAHAHARGVLHRDVKPANIVVSAWNDPRPGPKLTDFGIATLLDERAVPRRAGTAHTMAPEQIRGQHAEYGPWTDLYALACTVWQLVTGAPPFPGGDVDRVLSRQLTAAPPDFRPRFAVPQALEEWLRMLLNKAPAHRPQFAADALAELPSGEANSEAFGARHSAPLATTASTFFLEGDGSALVTDEVQVLVPADHLPEVPEHWGESAPALPLALHDAGLGLLGTRPPPLIGRDGEQEQLWGLLREAVRRGRPRLVALLGSGGTGKTALARWLGTAAHELGIAWHVHVRMTAEVLPARAVLAALTGTGLVDETERARVVRRWGRARAVDEAIMDLATDIVLERREVSAEDAAWTVAQCLVAASAARPGVLILDDVEQMPAMLDLVERVARRPGARYALVVVLCARSEPTEASALLTAEVEALVARHRACVCVLDRVAPAFHHELVRAVLPVDEVLCHRVAEQTRGHPSFVVEVLADLARQGRIEPTEGGFTLCGEGPVVLPREVDEAFRSRIQEVLAALGTPPEALYLAALLGPEVELATWRRACQSLSVDPGAMVAELSRMGVAAWGLPGSTLRWYFTSELLREAAIAQARTTPSWPALHRACAETFEAASRTPARLRAAVRHRLEAGDVKQAGELALYGLRVQHDRHRPHQRLELCDAVMHAARAGQGQPSWRVEALRHRASALTTLARFDEAMECLEQAEPEARALGMSELEAQLLRNRGTLLRVRGDMEGAQGALTRAVALVRSDPEARGTLAWARWSLARLQLESGDVDAAIASYELALGDMETAGDPRGRASVRSHLALALAAAQRPRDAMAHAREAVAIAEEAGQPELIGDASHLLGELAKNLGELDEAEEACMTSVAVYRRLGSRSAFFPLVNLGTVLRRRGDLVGSRQSFDEAMHVHSPGPVFDTMWALALPTLGALGDWSAWDRALARFGQARAEGYVEQELLDALDEAATQAAELGQARRAEEVRLLLETGER